MMIIGGRSDLIGDVPFDAVRITCDAQPFHHSKGVAQEPFRSPRRSAACIATFGSPAFATAISPFECSGISGSAREHFIESF
jgi:hypothetical protein